MQKIRETRKLESIRELYFFELKKDSSKSGKTSRLRNRK